MRALRRRRHCDARRAWRRCSGEQGSGHAHGREITRKKGREEERKGAIWSYFGFSIYNSLENGILIPLVSSGK